MVSDRIPHAMGARRIRPGPRRPIRKIACPWQSTRPSWCATTTV
jgi:hypothetical protein